MANCSHCGILANGSFCNHCGTPIANPMTYSPEPYPPQQGYQRETASSLPTASTHHHLTSHPFAQTFGLHPGMVVLTCAVNTMVFGGGIITGGIGWLTSVPVGVVLGIIIFMAQKKWYGDDNEAAFIKALIVAFLTAIPTSLPGYLTIPAGIIGFFRKKT